MTEQCKHEWRITCVWSDEYKMNVPKVYCRIGDCGEELPIENALARLNEYETLKAATDRLGLEWARQFVEDCDEAMETTSGVTMEIYRSDIELLRAYADTLEEKP